MIRPARVRRVIQSLCVGMCFLAAASPGQGQNRPDAPSNTSTAEIRFDAKGVDFGAWMTQFSAQMTRNWSIGFESIQQLRQEETVEVRCNVTRNGQVTDVEIVRGSTIDLLNVSATQALTQSSPLNPLPAPFPDESFPITVAFHYRPPEREFVFAGPAEFYANLDQLTFESLTPERIKKDGLRFFMLRVDSSSGRTFTRVRVRSRSGSERIGWIDKVPAAGQPPRASSNPVRIGGDIRPPQKTKHVNPVYPSAAQNGRAQGVVVIESTMGRDGKVTDAMIIRSIPLLDAAALDAVRQWEFSPTLLDGVPVSVIMTVTVQFTLN